MISKEKVGVGFSLVIFVLFSWAAIEAHNFRELAKFFPYYIGIIGAFLTLCDLVMRVIKIVKNKDQEVEPLHENLLTASKYLLIIISFLVLIYIFGIFIGTAMYLFCFLYFETKFGFYKAVLSAAIVMIGIMFFGEMMNLYWPKSMLDSFLK